jgi:hypothetical protein
MNSKCPYCGGPLHGNDLIPPMNKRRRRLYDAVVRNGTSGIEAKDLLQHMYVGDQKQTPSARSVLRVQIHELNRDIRQVHQKISAVDGSYYLFPTKE